MIVGVVNDQYELEVAIAVEGPGSYLHHVQAVLDTGFTGALTMPASMIAALGLPWIGQLAND